MLTITHEPMCQMSPMVSAQAMISAKQREQIEIDEAKDRFKKAGGKITVYATPAVVAPRTKTQKCMDEKRKVAQSNIRRDRGKGSLKYISLKPGKIRRLFTTGNTSAVLNRYRLRNLPVINTWLKTIFHQLRFNYDARTTNANHAHNADENYSGEW